MKSYTNILGMPYLQNTINVTFSINFYQIIAWNKNVYQNFYC